jgi:GNAT superfamily N-acetyltransferase
MAKPVPNFALGPMTLPELEMVLQWAAEEGWNPGIADAAAFFPTGGYYVAKLPNGLPIAAISVVPHTPTMAFLGFYICHPDWRGQGVGLAMWKYGLSKVDDRSCIGLDAVPAQVANYQRSGFQNFGATMRYQKLIDDHYDDPTTVSS